MEIVFESANLRVGFVPAREARRSDRIVIAFRSLLASLRKTGLDFPTSGESQITIQRSGADALHFLPANNRWYQYPEMQEALAIAKAYSERYRNITTYGMSMGGFAALQSSAFLNACSTVTYSPQISVDERKYDFIQARWLDRMRGVTFCWDDLGNISRTAQHIVVYDPFERDRRHVAVLRSVATVTEVRVPFSGHHCWRALGNAGIGGTALTRLLMGNPDIAWLRKTIRAGRRDDAVYLERMRDHLAARSSRLKT
jgi:hypothetical protein